jgi:predicted negative regulator of RcsB-dependent stress response
VATVQSLWSFTVDRQTRKDLKTDKFAQEVGHTFEFLADHRDQVQRYGIVLAVLVVLGGAYYFYYRSQGTKREEALAAALSVDNATVGPQQQPPLMNFPTAAEKEKARQKAFGDLASKYHGTQEGTIATLYLASSAVDRGDNAAAERMYKDAIDSGPAPYASVASIALADVLSTEGKVDEAEKLLRKVMANPTEFVSKEEATLHLAEAITATKPKEARALLEPLRASRSTVSRTAIADLGKLPASAN